MLARLELKKMHQKIYSWLKFVCLIFPILFVKSHANFHVGDFKALSQVLSTVQDYFRFDSGIKNVGDFTASDSSVVLTQKVPLFRPNLMGPGLTQKSTQNI